MPSSDRQLPLRLVVSCYVAACFLAGCSSAARGQLPASAEPWELCQSPELAIPDFSQDGAHDLSPSIEECIPITDINLYVDITHSWVGDLVVLLKLTVGFDVYSTIVLDRPGFTGTGFGCDGDGVRNTFDDEGDWAAESSCSGGSIAYPGFKHLTPNNPMFDGLDLTTCGYWEIWVYDQHSSDIGVLHEWCVRVNHVFQDDFEGGGFAAWSAVVYPGD